MKHNSNWLNHLSGESIPIRLFLNGYDLTPTMRDINKKFSVRYYLNLVLVDEEDRRYFKQQVHACCLLFTGPPHGPVLFCSQASVVCNAAGRWASRPLGAWSVGHCRARRVCGRLTPHGGPVRLRPVRATPCLYLYKAKVKDPLSILETGRGSCMPFLGH